MKSTYKAAVVTVMVMAFLSTPVDGQNYEKKGWGYGLLGAGSACGEDDQNFLHYGGGGEVLLYKGLGVAAEFGYLDRSDSDGMVVFSPGGIYAFNTGGKTIPFITAGYSFLFYDRREVRGAFFGAGINHLIGDYWGIRIEGRDHRRVTKRRTAHFTTHYLEARLGVFFSWD